MNQIRYIARDCKDKDKIDNFLKETRIGVIGMNGVGMNGIDFPYAVPVNFVWYDNSIFFHGMGSGKKENILSEEPPVCFTVYVEYRTVTDPVPCHADTSYMSVMLFGKVEKVVDFEKKVLVLNKLMEKYTPGYYQKPVNSKLVENYRSSFDGKGVSVYCLKPEDLTAKENQADESELFNE